MFSIGPTLPPLKSADLPWTSWEQSQADTGHFWKHHASSLTSQTQQLVTAQRQDKGKFNAELTVLPEKPLWLASWDFKRIHFSDPIVSAAAVDPSCSSAPVRELRKLGDYQ